jgi:hypothetical protein
MGFPQRRTDRAIVTPTAQVDATLNAPSAVAFAVALAVSLLSSSSLSVPP